MDELNNGKRSESIEQPYFINFGAFQAGVWHGAVPSRATLKIQVGFPSQHTPEEIFDIVKTLSGQVSERIQVTLSSLKTNAHQTEPDGKLIKDLQTIIEQESGSQVPLTTVTGHCDMRFFPTKDICLYGPGGGKNPHGIDEYYILDHLPIVAQRLIHFALRWCNETKALGS